MEYGFADSTGDDVLQIKNNWQDLTEAVVIALADYIGVPYTPPNGSGDTSTDIYVVKKGDSLYAIARDNNTTVDVLKKLNNLTSNNLSIGMVLRLPEKSSNGSSTEVYIVKPGDSLYKIANIYGMSVEDLKTLNNLTSNIINIGQELKVKNQINDIPANTYIVKYGDTLFSIAKRFGVSVDELKRVNNKSSNTLSIGENLIIPTSSTNYLYHTVVPGDTLYSIARQNGVTVNAIKSTNNLINDILSIGMILKIPK